MRFISYVYKYLILNLQEYKEVCFTLKSNILVLFQIRNAKKFALFHI